MGTIRVLICSKMSLPKEDCSGGGLLPRRALGTTAVRRPEELRDDKLAWHSGFLAVYPYREARRFHGAMGILGIRQ